MIEASSFCNLDTIRNKVANKELISIKMVESRFSITKCFYFWDCPEAILKIIICLDDVTSIFF